MKTLVLFAALALGGCTYVTNSDPGYAGVRGLAVGTDPDAGQVQTATGASSPTSTDPTQDPDAGNGPQTLEGPDAGQPPPPVDQDAGGPAQDAAPADSGATPDANPGDPVLYPVGGDAMPPDFDAAPIDANSPPVTYSFDAATCGANPAPATSCVGALAQLLNPLPTTAMTTKVIVSVPSHLHAEVGYVPGYMTPPAWELRKDCTDGVVIAGCFFGTATMDLDVQPGVYYLASSGAGGPAVTVTPL